jgi:hypothetical protein
LAELWVLNLSANELSGSIPPAMGNCDSLNTLYLNDNRLTGEIPLALANLDNLESLYLGGNELTGAIPGALGSLLSLETLRLNDNSLAGTLPSELGNLVALRDLDVSHNALSGPVPSSITNLVSLATPFPWGWVPPVDLGYNALWTNDLGVRAFLTDKDPDWASTQGLEVVVTPDALAEFTLAGSEGSSIAIQIPAGAVTDPTRLVIIPATEPTTAPASLSFAGQAFTLEAYRDDVRLEPFAFEQPVTATLDYLDWQILGFDEATLKLYVWEDPDWVDAAATCSPPSSYVREPELNRLRVAICHLSEYALLGVHTGQYHSTAYLPVMMK